MSTELAPTEKARRTRLINEAIDRSEAIKFNGVRLKEIQEELWGFAEPEIQANGGKSCTFTTSAGSCEVVASTVIILPDESVGNLRAALGERFEELVAVEQKYSLSSGLKRLLEKPQPQEKTLAERIRQCLRFRTSSRFTFKPAA